MSDSADSPGDRRSGGRSSARSPGVRAGETGVDERPPAAVDPEELSAIVDALEAVPWQVVPGLSAVTAATFTAEVQQAQARLEARQERESGRSGDVGDERGRSR